MKGPDGVGVNVCVGVAVAAWVGATVLVGETVGVGVPGKTQAVANLSDVLSLSANIKWPLTRFPVSGILKKPGQA